MSATEADRKRAADHRGRPSSTFIEVVCALLQWSGKVDIVVRIRDFVAALDAVGAFCTLLMLMDIEISSMKQMKAVSIDASWLLPLELSGCLQTNRREIRADAQACGQSFIYKPRFPEEFRGALAFRWGMLRGGTEAHQFLTRSSQQLYTACLLSKRLTYRQCGGAATVSRYKKYKRADEGWLGVRTMYLSSAVDRGVSR